MLGLERKLVLRLMEGGMTIINILPVAKKVDYMAWLAKVGQDDNCPSVIMDLNLNNIFFYCCTVHSMKFPT